MPRIHFIEINEQPWLPTSIRDQITDSLQFGVNLVPAFRPMVPRLQCVLDATGSQSIVDMCSGGGGPWRDLAQRIKARTTNGTAQPLQIWLTDKFPNLGAHQNVATTSGNHIAFFPGPVDVMNVCGVRGVRTMFTSFHHFAPEQAQGILQNAVDAGEGIGIFEVTRRAPAAILLVWAWIFMLFVCTPWIRPFHWTRLLWTYVVPIVPVLMLFDGTVSCLRTYRPEELRAIVSRLTGPEYHWETGETSGKMPITYLVGYPRIPGNAEHNA
ncbi:MAG TPA: hypothetical protein VKR59_19590 [Terriglobales bacterium]|nr:hypothetical protein [Terriglobales bacterium]